MLVKGTFTLPAYSPWLSGIGMRIWSIKVVPFRVWRQGAIMWKVVATGNGLGRHLCMVLFGATVYFSVFRRTRKPSQPLDSLTAILSSVHVVNLNFKRAIA